EIPSLRCVRVVRELEGSFRRACDRGDFRLVHYSLLHPRAPAGRGRGRVGARAGYEVHRGAPGACREPRVRPAETGARGALPCPGAPHPARGPAGSRLRVAERAPARTASAAGERDRSRVVRPLVCWVAARPTGNAVRSRCAGGGAAAHLAATGRLAAPWID